MCTECLININSSALLSARENQHLYLWEKECQSREWLRSNKSLLASPVTNWEPSLRQKWSSFCTQKSVFVFFLLWWDSWKTDCNSGNKILTFTYQISQWNIFLQIRQGSMSKKDCVGYNFRQVQNLKKSRKFRQKGMSKETLRRSWPN